MGPSTSGTSYPGDAAGPGSREILFPERGVARLSPMTIGRVLENENRSHVAEVGAAFDLVHGTQVVLAPAA